MCKKTLYIAFLVTILSLANITTAFDDPLAYYPMEEGSGTVVGDASGNGHDGTIEGALVWGEGAPGFGGCLTFDGDYANRVDLGTWNPSDPATGKMSGAAWIKWSGEGTWPIIAGKGSDGGMMFQWLIDGAGSFGDAQSIGINVGASMPAFGTALAPVDEWIHAAFSHNGTEFTLYADGENAGTVEQTFDQELGDRILTIGAVNNNQAGELSFEGSIDEVAFFNTDISEADVLEIMNGGLGVKGLAGGANPANGADDVWPRDITLSWTAGEFADKHDLYFSTNFDDVNDGVALLSGGQNETSYEIGDLELETTYYWRVDEVNAPSSPGTIAGKVWSFTTEPIGYPLPSENIVGATASSRYEGSDPNKTYDGSGIDVNDMHSIEGADMWVSDECAPGESWIKYEFDGVYRLHQMKVWNYNETSLANFGFKDVTVEYSLDDLEWYALTDVPQFAKATGKAVCAADTTVDFGGVEAKYVKITALKNWGSFIYQQYGLSEVRFLCVPLKSRYPSPDDEDTGVAVDVTLGWRAGRDAESHNVSYSFDEAAVAGGTATVHNVSEMSYGPVSLNLGTMYYWKVDEVDSNNVYAGSVWSFSTQEYIVVEDFEFYTDDEPNRVWDFWTDGWDDTSNGSTMGYPDPVFEDGEHFVETTFVYNGSQSGPLLYNNTVAADGVTPVNYSEVTLDLGSAQNWTSNGADEVIMSFHGNAVEFYESDDGSIAMSAEGVDIYGTEDEFRYAYKTLNGDGSITVRVDSIQNTNVWSKAGIMIRNSLEPNDVHVTAVLAASGTAELEYRDEMGGSTTTRDVTGLGNPCWLRITRSGDDFTLERSTDGVEWLSFETDANNASTETVDMGNTVYIGLVVTSHEADVPAAATFYNPTTTGNVSSGDWTVEVIGADTEHLVVNTIDKLYLALVDNSGHRHDVYAPVITAVGWGDWYEWKIPQSEYSSNGVNMASIRKIIVGVGDSADPMHGKGTIFIDDIGYGHSLSAEE